jgi:hypothetical protein
MLRGVSEVRGISPASSAVRNSPQLARLLANRAIARRAASAASSPDSNSPFVGRNHGVPSTDAGAADELKTAGSIGVPACAKNYAGGIIMPAVIDILKQGKQ